MAKLPKVGDEELFYLAIGEMEFIIRGEVKR
jgi:hypothetical protein